MKGSFPLVSFTNSGISIAEGCKVFNVMNSCTVCFYFCVLFLYETSETHTVVKTFGIWKVMDQRVHCLVNYTNISI